MRGQTVLQRRLGGGARGGDRGGGRDRPQLAEQSSGRPSTVSRPDSTIGLRVLHYPTITSPLRAGPGPRRHTRHHTPHHTSRRHTFGPRRRDLTTVARCLIGLTRRHGSTAITSFPLLRHSSHRRFDRCTAAARACCPSASSAATAAGSSMQVAEGVVIHVAATTCTLPFGFRRRRLSETRRRSRPRCCRRLRRLPEGRYRRCARFHFRLVVVVVARLAPSLPSGPPSPAASACHRRGRPAGRRWCRPPRARVQVPPACAAVTAEAAAVAAAAIAAPRRRRCGAPGPRPAAAGSSCTPRRPPVSGLRHRSRVRRRRRRRVGCRRCRDRCHCCRRYRDKADTAAAAVAAPAAAASAEKTGRCCCRYRHSHRRRALRRRCRRPQCRCDAVDPHLPLSGRHAAS